MDRRTRLSAGHANLARFTLTFALVLAVCLWLLEVDRPPADPQLTISRAGGDLVVLIEGRGGGRLLVGGGRDRTAAMSSLGRILRPWDTRLDMVLVAAVSDLPAAIDLARQGRVAMVALLPPVHSRPSVALDELRVVAAKAGVAVNELAGDETLRVGAGPQLIVEFVPRPDGAIGMLLRTDVPLVALSTDGSVPPAAPVVVFTRTSATSYAAALQLLPKLLVAPSAPPVGREADGARDARLLYLADGERAVLVAAPPGIRLRGPVPQTPYTAGAR